MNDTNQNINNEKSDSIFDFSNKIGANTQAWLNEATTARAKLIEVKKNNTQNSSNNGGK